ncbi:hypothetical protein SARC_11218 [Sphaeroforma arctica JP610]|uniref:Uncharacterized protein n=1 Tax=Sphaeroforma arctica JP610 TaxID=667725 RepID=A0A0L0FJR6_9EUKA|nr:hypothetical protein SARC_11218 [Sphaeroforma arctica JP610]KNC76273.1 hypothetical protein SARC_11218 [Sphaeroforma arctica JP610]|eukprot:XP_014150175.1 hypothetical protein SARC_11218 [Sphaeroforma arctica JP610]
MLPPTTAVEAGEQGYVHNTHLVPYTLRSTTLISCPTPYAAQTHITPLLPSAYRPELSITRDTADSPLLMSPAVAESSCHGNLRAAHGVGHGSSDTWVTCVNHLLSRIPLPPVPTFSQFAESAVALECGSEDKNGSETTHEGHGKGLHSREKRPIVGHKSKEHHVYRTAAALSDEAQIIALTTRSDACDDVRYQSPGPHATDDTEKEGEEHNKTTHREVGGRTVGEAQDTDRPAHAGKDGECTDTASAQIARGTTHNATHGSKHSTNIYGSKHSTHKGGEGSADAAQATGESVYVFKGTQISDCVQIGADTIEVTRSLRDSEATLSAAQRLDAALIVEAKHGKGSTKESTQGSVHGSIQYYTTAHTRYTSHARDMHLVPDCRASRSEGDTAHVCADSELDFTRAHMGEASQDIQRSRASTSPTRACGPQATESVQLRETQRFRYYREKERLMYQNTLERNNDATPKFGQPAFPLAMNIYCTRTQSLPLGRTCAGADVQPLNTRSPHAHRGKGAERQTQMQRPKNVNGQGRGRSVLSSRANKFKCKNDKQCVPVDRRRRIKTDRQKTTNKYTPTHTHATAERCTEAPHSATDQEHTVHKHTTPHPNTVPHSHSAAHKSVTRHGQPGASASRHPTRDTHSTRRMHSTADEGAGTQDTACSAATAKTATTPPYKPSRPTVRFAPTPDKAYKKSRIPAFSTPEKVRNYRSTPSKQKENKPPPIKTPGVSSKDKAIAPGNTPKKCATFEGTCLQLALSPADKPLPSAHIKRHSQTQTKRPSQTTANGRRRTPLADTDSK